MRFCPVATRACADDGTVVLFSGLTRSLQRRPSAANRLDQVSRGKASSSARGGIGNRALAMTAMLQIRERPVHRGDGRQEPGQRRSGESKTEAERRRVTHAPLAERAVSAATTLRRPPTTWPTAAWRLPIRSNTATGRARSASALAFQRIGYQRGPALGGAARSPPRPPSLLTGGRTVDAGGADTRHSHAVILGPRPLSRADQPEAS